MYIYVILTNNIWFCKKFCTHNALSIVNQRAEFLLNLPTKTVVTAAFVRSPYNVKCLVLNNRLFNSVHDLLKIKQYIITPYPFYCLSSLIKTRSSAENVILLVFMLFCLRQ